MRGKYLYDPLTHLKRAPRSQVIAYTTRVYPKVYAKAYAELYPLGLADAIADAKLTL
jgi:hypothetical protein